MSFLSKIFGDANERYINSLGPIVEKINNLEKEFHQLSDADLKNKTQEFKERLRRLKDEGQSEGDALNDLLPEAFAAVREASKRVSGKRHFDVQLMGGIVLHQGKIAEMKTGEGKTLVATLPAYLNALEDRGVHVITVNDYLSRRDAVWMGQVYDALGLSVGCINHDSAYIYDVSHINPKSQISNLENDSIEMDKKRDIEGGFHVVHEFLKSVPRQEAYKADILYGTNNEFGFDYLRDNMVYDESRMAQRMENTHHFAIVDEVDSILIDEARTPLIISAPDIESTKLYETFAKVVPHLIENEDYTIDEKLKAVSITESGIEKVEKRLGIANIYEQGGIRHVHHLEQALKAHVLFKRDRDYVVKDGEVLIVDEFTGRLMPSRRWSEGLHQAIEAKEAVKVEKESRTLATITFQNYFRLYKKLAGMTGTAKTSAEEFHKVYNLDVVMVPTNKPMSRQDHPDRIYRNEVGKFKAIAREIKERNEKGQPVLVGTVSIEKNELLSSILEREGVPHNVLNAKNHEREAEIIAQAGRLNGVTVATNMAGRGVDIILGGNPPSPEETRRVQEVGGLHVIGTERHEARRIDDQLRGRSGRQGDSGSSQFFVSTEDDLVRVFGGERLGSIMERLGVGDDDVIENRFISSAIAQAQSRVEGHNFDIRKYVLEYDDVVNKHREAIYGLRKKIFTTYNNKDLVLEYIQDRIENAEQLYGAREKELGSEQMRAIEKMVLLRTIDELWMDHIEMMEYLRDSVRLRAYGQRDPLVEYKTEAQRLFRELQESIKVQVASVIFKAGFIEQPLEIKGEEKRVDIVSGKPNEANEPKSLMSSDKVGRNDPCPCGSGKKYKRCHGK